MPLGTSKSHGSSPSSSEWWEDYPSSSSSSASSSGPPLLFDFYEIWWAGGPLDDTINMSVRKGRDIVTYAANAMDFDTVGPWPATSDYDYLDPWHVGGATCPPKPLREKISSAQPSGSADLMGITTGFDLASGDILVVPVIMGGPPPIYTGTITNVRGPSGGDASNLDAVYTHTAPLPPAPEE